MPYFTVVELLAVLIVYLEFSILRQYLLSLRPGCHEPRHILGATLGWSGGHRSVLTVKTWSSAGLSPPAWDVGHCRCQEPVAYPGAAYWAAAICFAVDRVLRHFASR